MLEPIGGREQASVCLAAGVRRGGVGSGSRHCLSRQSIEQQEHCQVDLPILLCVQEVVTHFM